MSLIHQIYIELILSTDLLIVDDMEKTFSPIFDDPVFIFEIFW